VIYACRQLQDVYLVYELGLILCKCPFIPDTVLSCLFNLAQIVMVCLLIIFRFFHVAKVARITLYSLSLCLCLPQRKEIIYTASSLHCKIL